MHACMYVCMYVCMCVCVCMYVCMYVCMNVCMYVCMYVRYHPVTTAHTRVDFSRGTTRICTRGPREVKAVVHDHKWLKSTRGLKPCVV